MFAGARQTKWMTAVLMLLGVLAIPQEAKAWWNDDWSYRKKITIDAGAKGINLGEDAGRIPLLIRLHDGNFNFTDAGDEGIDLRFVDSDDKTPLKFHIDTYDGLLGMALVWVDLPQLAAGKTHDIWLYFGNEKATQAADPHGTYDADTTLVYHFGEKDAPAHDQTAYGNNAQTAGKSVDNSLIGRGLSFDGTNPITLPPSPSLAIAAGGSFSWSAWVKPDAAQPTSVLFAKHDGNNALVIGIDQNIPYVSVTTGGQTVRSNPGASITAGAWHHLVVSASGQITVFVDGKPGATLAATLPALTGVATLGGDIAPAVPAAPAAPAAAAPTVPKKAGAASAKGAPPAATPTAAPTAAPGFVGELDELEIAKSARSPGFVAATFATQGPDAAAISFGQDEENASWTGGYFGVILKSVTIDGWVVIGILGVMAAISWTVMIGKAFYLSRVTRATRRFLEIFDRIGADAKRLEAHFKSIDTKYIDSSPLYRVCREGTGEWVRRMDGGSATALSAEAIESIRASLDRVAVYEGQRLNSAMVLLTIAISGGPFLGLLGTVVGVMITFAAIAASGDVNINAIAPGIAAALVATVAGLGVAIPALFGYNWLITSIKNVNAEMQVFIDEFVTRLAEPALPHPGEQLAAE